MNYLRYDTVHGKFKHDVKIGEKDELIVNGNKIKCIQASREGPKALPWKDRIYQKFDSNIQSDSDSSEGKNMKKHVFQIKGTQRRS